MMATTRFDPKPGRIYGKCRDCGIEIATQELSRQHLDGTSSKHGSRSHSVIVLNPSRQSQISSHIAWRLDVAINAAFEDLMRDVERGDLTVEEISGEMYSYPDFSDGWDEFVEEGRA
jgi:hypothetical protein